MATRLYDFKKSMAKTTFKLTVADAAAIMGKLGGLKGGKARAASLTPEQRSKIARLGAMALNKKLSSKQRSANARNAVLARWKKKRKKSVQ